jgi:hypothetical protein
MDAMLIMLKKDVSNSTILEDVVEVQKYLRNVHIRVQ